MNWACRPRRRRRRAHRARRRPAIRRAARAVRVRLGEGRRRGRNRRRRPHCPAAPAAPDAIETFIAELAAGDDWAAAIDDITGPLIDRVENAKSYDDLIATLARALDGMDAGALAEKLARATFQARLAGGEAADLKAKNGGN
uniref:phage portal protein family protein n=1 Tax=Varunaivibrio sulfuroxidans TaxID=1773489 RepID=UPI00389986C1